MPVDDLPPIDGSGNGLRLQTLVLLRWMAVAGQLAALFVAERVAGLDLDISACLGIVALSVLLNLLSTLFWPGTQRLGESAAFVFLAFDSLQLAALLYLTGGLNNPFALLFLAPATIAATALGSRATAGMAALTLLLVSVLALYHLPLRLADGSELHLPGIFLLGFWAAIGVGVVFLALYARRVSGELQAVADALTATQLALAREQKLTDLSGVVAAAAHELGTPLATIMLAGSELASELAHAPELQSDARLILEQAERCRGILRSMGRSGKDDLHMRAAPFLAVVQEAAEPHSHRHAMLRFGLARDGATQPMVVRRPEIIHGLRNLVQNAVDFSRGNVWVDLDWTADRILVTISDDGPGFPPHIIGRLGDPSLWRRQRNDTQVDVRKAYEGMGLGLFIAKTLLERTGATLTFANGSDPFLSESERPERSGAIARVTWARADVTPEPMPATAENPPSPA